MLKFGLGIALDMIQKSDAAIFEILIFCTFSGVKVQILVQMADSLAILSPIYLLHIEVLTTIIKRQ